MASAASRIGAGGFASTSASASTAGTSSTSSSFLTAPASFRRHRRRQSCCLDSSTRASRNRHSDSASASKMIRAMHLGECGSRFSTAAERRRPHQRTTSSSSLAASAFGLGRSGSSSSSKGKKGPVVVIDNYDSFTYNLCQYLGNLGCDFVVVANDAATVCEIDAMNPAGVLVSPGPGAPEESGISLEAVAVLGPKYPLFGVCMGHQCIGKAFGGDVVRAPGGVMHGKTSPVVHGGVGLLRGLPSPFLAARYHSLVIDSETCPPCLEVTARTEEEGGGSVIMAVRHREFPWIQGVQFHPESIITDGGMQIVENFVEMVKAGTDGLADAATREKSGVAG